MKRDELEQWSSTLMAKGYSEELVMSKQVQALIKNCGGDRAIEVLAMDAIKLKELISGAHIQAQKITEETRANPEYKKAAGIKKEFDSAARDARKPFLVTVAAATSIVQARTKK